MYLFAWCAARLIRTLGQLRPSKALTCNEGVLDAKAETLQLLVAVELDPHEPSSGRHQSGVLHSAEAIDERRESKRPIADFDVIKAALKRRLHVVILIKSQLDPLSGESCGNKGVERKNRKKVLISGWQN